MKAMELEAPTEDIIRSVSSDHCLSHCVCSVLTPSICVQPPSRATEDQDRSDTTGSVSVRSCKGICVYSLDM